MKWKMKWKTGQSRLPSQPESESLSISSLYSFLYRLVGSKRPRVQGLRPKPRRRIESSIQSTSTSPAPSHVSETIASSLGSAQHSQDSLHSARTVIPQGFSSPILDQIASPPSVKTVVLL
jgi:hypothetical protein